ncbi:S-adenosylmethionine:tRNA ribosyltransferase-isomerase [Streptomyces sp. NPDC093252]|uniref:S-adenosylmethionine:tRNA ribosyltransferase-isomerase n=1 Tax=Streptomyces sp. NPDC093252 TaxID=3154980 RepID=UPI00343045B3
MTPAPRVPEELSARVPAEQRGTGLGRDGVRLLVSRGTLVSHHAFVELPRLLRAGDLLVVNTSPTLAAAVDGTLGHARVVVHFSTRGDDGRWSVELREPDGRGTTRAWAGGPEGAVVGLPGGGGLVLEEPVVGLPGGAGSGVGLSGAAGVGVGVGLPGGTGPGVGLPRKAGAVLGSVASGPVLEGPVGTGPVLEQAVGSVGRRLWWARVSDPDVPGLLRAHGRAIRYAYTERDQPLSAYQTVFALPSPDGSGSAEMPSAARPFTARLVAELVSRGVQFAPVRLDTGVASVEAHEPPYPERFTVPEASARLVNAVRAGDGRVIAVGTTAVRALESAVGPSGAVRAAQGWTDLVVDPGRGVRAVDGILTGLHEPQASHLLMLEAVAGRAAVDRGYEAALRGRYLWHEFGDVHLLLPEENPHAKGCSGNCW